jgi:hypothetical protein
VVLAGLSLIPGILAGQALERGRDAVEAGRTALLNLEAGSKAGESFAVAEAAFRDARRWAENPLIRLEGLIPILGRTPDAIGRLARAGQRIATAGSALSQGVSAIPGGLPGLAPRGGRLPIETIQTLAPAVARARRELEASEREVRPINAAWTVPPVGEATALVRSELGEALALIRPADAILTGLPDLAGVDGKRRYFLAAENPAEARGTGGIIGLYSIMTIDDGHIDIGPFHDRPPPSLKPGALMPPPDLTSPYTGFNSATFWLSVNTTPDAPTAAVMIENLYRKVTGQRLNGVVFIKPQALSPLLRALGPVEIPRLEYTVTPENVVDFTTNQAYFLFNNRQKLRNRALGLVTEEVLNRFFAANRPKAAVKGLVDAAARGFIAIHSTDPGVQQGFAEAGIDGDFTPGDGEFFAVVANSFSRNKVDYYVERTIDYDVELLDGGQADTEATVTLENTAPIQEGFNEALGPFPTHRRFPDGLVLRSGEAYPFLSFYCSASCTLREPQGPARSENVVPFSRYPQRGAQMFATSVRIKSQESRTFDLSLHSGKAWSGDDVQGTYLLRFRDQPVVKPTAVRLSIKLPPGMRMMSANIPITFEGDRLVWEGSLGEVQDIRIRFERPLLEKLWVKTKDFLTRPVFQIG